MVEHLDAPVDEHRDVAANQEDYPKQADVPLVAPLVDEDLGELDGRKGESMQRKDQVLVCNLSQIVIVK